MSKIKVDQDFHSGIATVLESLGVRKNPTEYGSSTVRPDPLLALDSKFKSDSDETKPTVPFELIVSCVAAYHVIQVGVVLLLRCTCSFLGCT